MFFGFGVNEITLMGLFDTGKDQTIYQPDGKLNSSHIARLVSILQDADEENIVILLVLFSRESWNENRH